MAVISQACSVPIKNPAAIAALAREWQSPDADARQAALDAVRAAFQKFPMIPALKAVVAHFSGDDAWGTVRPPLIALTAEQRRQLVDALGTLRFSMPGLADEAIQHASNRLRQSETLSSPTRSRHRHQL